MVTDSPYRIMDVKVLLIVLFGICTSQAFHTFFPEGKELTYEYFGTISASTEFPRPYSSYFGLHGNLHVQRDNQTVLLKFSDLEYKLFNGLDDEFDSKILPIPKEMEDFSKAFRINYHPTGNIAGITTGKDEKQYVVNFKKGISSMFQLDLEMIEKYDNQDICAFHTEENTIYGKGKVNYNVKANKDTYHIEIMQEPHSMKHMYTHFLSNVDYQSHRSDFNEPLTRDSQRSCVLTKIGNDKIINNIESTGGIYNTPYNGKGEAHIIYTNQSVSLISTNPISSKFDVQFGLIHEGLAYYIADLNHVNSAFPDVTNGRRTLPSWEIMTDNAIALIKDIIDYVTNYKIVDERPDFKKSQIVHRLSILMMFFDDEAFNIMFEKLSQINEEKYINIYVQMLTELGTHAGYRHVLKLKREGKITNESFLYNMFNNVRYPNKNLVDEMAEILKWDSKDYTPSAYTAAILSFGTLLNKAVERNKRYTDIYHKKHHKHDFGPDNTLSEEFPDHRYYEKYVYELVSKLKETKQYDHQILYLKALYNTRIESIVQHLLPAIKGEWWKDSHLRMIATLAISPIVVKNEDLTYEIFWPFMTNPSTPTTFRIMSYLMIMKSQPSLPRLINIYWVMSSTKNADLYMFHYKYITARSESEIQNNRKFIINIRKILKYTYKPVFRGITGYNHFDYFDEDYSLGEDMEVMTIHSKLENDIILAGSYKYSVNGATAAPYWIFMRIAGFDPSFLKAIQLDTSSKTLLFTWNNLKNVFMALRESNDVKVTLIKAINGHVTTTCVYDKNNIMELVDLVKLLKGTEMKETSVDISYELLKTLILPSDMGFPVISFNYVPDIDFTNIALAVRIDDDEIDFVSNIKFKSLTLVKRGLFFYNPFLDVTQAVCKLHTSDTVINFNLSVSIDMRHHALKMSWTNEFPDEVLVGEKMYTSTVVYVNDDFNTGILQKSASGCKNYEYVTLGEEYKTNKTTRILPLIDIGSDFLETVFDLEEPLPVELDPHIDMNSDKSNDLLREILYPLRFEEIQPADINYGMTRIVRANKGFPVDSVDLRLKFDTEYKKGNNYLYPAVTYKMKLHCASAGSAGTFTSWSADAKLEMDDGHMNTAFGAHVSKRVGELVASFCAAGDSSLILPTAESDSSHFKSTIYLSANFLMEDTSNMCTQNNSLLQISIQGEKSAEQREGKLTYETCHKDVVGPIENQKSLDCLFEYDSLRHYTVSIKHILTNDKDDEYKEKWSELSSHLFSDSDSIEMIDGIKSNEIRAVFDLPMKPTEFSKINVYTEDSATSHQLSEKLQSLDTGYGSMFEFMHEYGLTDVCLINHPAAKCTNANGVKYAYTPSKVWTEFLVSNKTEYKFIILMKSAEGNHMALKFEVGSHTLIIEPKGDVYVFTIDGNEIKKNVWTNEWMHYACITNTKLVSIYIEHMGVHIIYNGHQASIEYPQIEGIQFDGYCLYGEQPTE